MITLTDNDDPRFIDLARRLLNTAITSGQAAELYVIRVDQWFDAKWLKFSGKVLGALGVHGRPVTVPPFHPHRVVAESHFTFASGSNAFVPTSAPPLHIAQPSAQNLMRTIVKVSPSAIFFWYSASTLGLDRGSTMLYRTNQNEVFSWYASFRRSTTWRLDRYRGISPTEVQRQLECA
jgi:hypothetical protein